MPPTIEGTLHDILRQETYDRVIVLNSGLDLPITPIRFNNLETWEWSWGYDPEQMTAAEEAWTIPSRGHEWTWVPPQLRNHLRDFQSAQIFIGGGFERECLQDWADVLTRMGLEFTKVRELIF